MKKYIIITVLVTLSGILFSCSDNSTDAVSPPQINSIEPLKASPGDIITIFGNNLGYKPVNGRIILNELVINYSKTEKWNNAFIRFQLPLTAKSGYISVILGTDSSNSVYYEVEEKPAIEFVDISSGNFMMGSNTGFGYEQPVHKVTISKDFLLSKYEITQKIWKLVMDSNSAGVQSDDLPAMNIKWEDAILFCNKLSKIYDYDTVYVANNGTYTYNKSADGFRLPTEAEWEYACRAGSGGDFPGTGNIDDMGWYNGNSAFNAHPVGTKNPNDWGLFDMNGNVWEWCWDWYSSDYYQTSPEIDPSGPASGNRRIIRGGSNSDGATFARSSNRTFPSSDFTNCGFRIAKNK